MAYQVQRQLRCQALHPISSNMMGTMRMLRAERAPATHSARNMRTALQQLGCLAYPVCMQLLHTCCWQWRSLRALTCSVQHGIICLLPCLCTHCFLCAGDFSDAAVEEFAAAVKRTPSSEPLDPAVLNNGLGNLDSRGLAALLKELAKERHAKRAREVRSWGWSSTHVLGCSGSNPSCCVHEGLCGDATAER
jgi:hypothetical protein